MSLRVLHKIAAGGTATVFVARSEDGGLVAVKRPHPHLFDDARFLESLRREAKIAARANHSSLVRTIELIEDGGNVDLVMEYVDGVSLAELVASWTSATPDAERVAAAVHVVMETCAGLDAIHSLTDEHGEPLRLVHRDVSPQNVLVTHDGHAKVTDFGLVRSIGGGDRSTTDGILKGKAGYLAPEYVRGAPIDQRIDVFAAGVVLWEAIAKRRLFQGENEAATLQRVLECKVPKLATAVPDGGAELDAILAEALARGPADRFATAADFGAALEKWLAARAPSTSAASVRATFGASAVLLLEERRAAIAAAGKAGQTRRAKPLWIAAPIVAIAIVGIARSFASGSTPPSGAAVEPTSSAPLVASVAVPPPSSSAQPPPEIELVDVPAAPSASASAPASHRVLPSRPHDAAGASTPEPRPNPYRGPR